MPTRNVNLTDELDRFVLQKVESGRYENASEVVRVALRTLEREEQRHEAKVAALRSGHRRGRRSGFAKGGVFERVRKKLTAVRRVSPWPSSVFRIVPKQISSALALICFAPGAKTRPFVTFASLRIVARSLPIIPRSAGPVIKFVLGFGG